MRRLAVIAVVALVAVIGGWLLLRGAGGGGASATPEPSIGPVPPSTEIVADGRVVPVHYAELTASVPGEVMAVEVSEGDAVTSGQKLVYLDDTSAAAEVKAATAAVATAEAGVTRAQALADQAAAQVKAADAAIVQARAVRDRAQAVRDGLPAGASNEQEAAADADVEAARAAISAAQANQRAAEAASQAAAAGVAAARGEVARAVAALDAADAAAAETTIVAPFSGTIASLDVRPGERATPGTVLLRIADTSSWLVETTDLDETTVARVAVGAPVTITFDGLPGVTVDGTVTSVALFGASNQGDIVYRAVVTPATTPEGLRWNMTATVTMTTAQ
jgi:multidrug resistance efflux pump